MTKEEAIKILKEGLVNAPSEEAWCDAFLMALGAIEQEPIEVEATKLQKAYNQGFEDCRKAVMDLLSEAGKLSLLAMVADLKSVNPQEPNREIEDYENEIGDLHNRLDIAECVVVQEVYKAYKGAR